MMARITGAVCLVWWMVVVFLQLFSCKPIRGFWDKSLPSSCIDRRKFYIGAAVPNILTDIIILSLSVRTVWQLQLSSGQKVGLSLTFLLGGL